MSSIASEESFRVYEIYDVGEGGGRWMTLTSREKAFIRVRHSERHWKRKPQIEARGDAPPGNLRTFSGENIGASA
jgi:hypothetical protein